MTFRYLPLFWCCLFLLWLTDCSEESESKNLPEIVSIEPSTGGYDMWVTIQANKVGPEPSDNIVKFNDKEATLLSVSQAEFLSQHDVDMTVVVPKDAGTGPVSITTGGMTAIGPTFTYVEPEKNVKYFFSFNVDGVPQYFEKMDSSFNHCSQCVCNFMDHNNGDFVGFKICGDELVTSKTILDLKGKTFPMRNNADSTYADFFYYVGTESYASGELNNLYSYLTIDDVVYGGSQDGYSAYNVSGTFEGVIENDDPEDFSVIAITEGKFLVRFNTAKPR